MKNNSVLIIGAGIGGLAVGIRLAAEGFRVRIVEKNDYPGGWLNPVRIGDFTFPNAGSLITMPQQLESLFSSAGRSLSDYLELEEFSPIMRFIFHSEHEYTLYREAADTLMKNSLFGLNDQQGYTAYGKRSDRILDEFQAKFFSKPYNRSRNPFVPEFGFRNLRPGRSGLRVSTRLFNSEELRIVHAFWSMFCGGAPSVSSHFYRIIPAVMQRWGVYLVKGGTDTLVNALVKLFHECGGEIQYNSEAQSIQVYNGAVTGVRLNDNSIRMADYVISDADTAHTCRNLIDSDRFRYSFVTEAKKRTPGISLFIYHMALKAPPVEKQALLGFNVIMPQNLREWEKELFSENRLPSDLMFYLNVPDKIDSAFVPEGKGSLTVICPVPNLNSEVNWPQESYRFRDQILTALQTYFENDLRSDLIGERYITPVMIQTMFNCYQGSVWGFSPNQEKTEVPHLPNQCGDIENLFLVGNGAHPGPFLPAILQSAEIVYQEIVSERHGK